MTAIIAGAVAGVAATVLSLWLSGDDSFAPRAQWLAEAAPTVGVPAHPGQRYAAGELEAWADPHGVFRARAQPEWRAVAAHGAPHPDDPFVEELRLRGLRVAQRWAFEQGDLLRAARLDARFDARASALRHQEGAVLEAMRMTEQRLGQRCGDAIARLAELRRLSDLFPGAPSAELLRVGLDAVGGCLEGTPPR